MMKEIIYSIKSPYREPMEIAGYRFGGDEKTIAIVGALRGNEIQQMYACGQLIHELRKLETMGKLDTKMGILIIPCGNSYSMNIGKRFWTMDNTDINRMFPGYELGETTQRIADGIFSKIKDFKYGIQFASFYQTGNFIPHVKMMNTGFADTELMKNFGFKYAILRNPRPYDTTTLNYNWQIWETQAFSVYAGDTDTINENQCRESVAAVLRFMKSLKIIDASTGLGYNTEIVEEQSVSQIRTETGGIFLSTVHAGDMVTDGQELGRIINALDGETESIIRSDCSGVVYFEFNRPLINQNMICYKIIRN